MAVKEIVQTIQIVRLLHDPENVWVIIGNDPPVRCINWEWNCPSVRDHEAEAKEDIPYGICRKPGPISTLTIEVDNGRN